VLKSIPLDSGKKRKKRGGKKKNLVPKMMRLRVRGKKKKKGGGSVNQGLRGKSFRTVPISIRRGDGGGKERGTKAVQI